jgi:UDP-N-acetylmuramate--alanine ligase
MDLLKINKVYFVGIGGIGISAAARILNQMGKQVSGSDATASEITVQLEKEGIDVFISQKAENIPVDTDLVVYTVAVPTDNPERQRATELGVSQVTYPQLLGILMRDKLGIGISGTDGKTTTTAILGKILVDADFDPTIVIGSKVDYLGGNSRIGESKYFVFESDEYKRAFHNYLPQIAGLTNIRADHLDVYKDLEDIKTAFVEYLERIPNNGLVVINNDDNNCTLISSGIGAKVVSYAIDTDADFIASDIKYIDGKQKFKVAKGGNVLGEVKLSMPGKYNVYNALLSIAIAMEIGIDFGEIKKSIDNFNGVWRRFEKLGVVNDTEIITDYAHTPEGLRQVILATQELYSDSNILFVFQPHQYNRTKNFKDDFISSIKTAKNIILSDIFYVKGREDPTDFNISSKELAEESASEYGGDLDKTEELIRSKIDDFDVVVLVGAGDIYNLAKKILINK